MYLRRGCVCAHVHIHIHIYVYIYAVEIQALYVRTMFMDTHARARKLMYLYVYRPSKCCQNICMQTLCVASAQAHVSVCLCVKVVKHMYADIMCVHAYASTQAHVSV